MKIHVRTIAVLTMFGTHAYADAITDLLDNAKVAYGTENIEESMTHTKDALELLQGRDLERYLPEAMIGWDRDIVAHGLSATMSNMYGGYSGSAVKAEYVNGDEQISLVLISESLMVRGIAAAAKSDPNVVEVANHIFSNDDGSLGGKTDQMVIWIDGNASLAKKIELIELLDFTAIEEFRGH